MKKGPDWVGIALVALVLYLVVISGMSCYRQITEGVPDCRPQPECEAYDDPYAGW